MILKGFKGSRIQGFEWNAKKIRIQGVEGSRSREKYLKIIKNENYGRKTTADYVRLLYIAYDSICELETYLLLSGDLNYVNKENLKALKDDTREVERMLKAFIR